MKSNNKLYSSSVRVTSVESFLVQHRKYHKEDIHENLHRHTDIVEGKSLRLFHIILHQSKNLFHHHPNLTKIRSGFESFCY